MKKLIAAILLFISFASYAQQTDASLRTQANIIRNATAPGSNTAVRVGDMFLSIINNKPNYIGEVVASGTDTYIGTEPNIATYGTSLIIDVNFANANTTSSTININGLGAKTLQKFSSGSLTNLVSGDIATGQTLRFRYNGTVFTLVGSPPGGGGGGSGTVTSITATSPLTGGVITTSGSIGIANAAADGSTKGAATFNASDFDATSGVVSIDYTNAQKASASLSGILSTTDWNTFNTKPSATAGGDLSGTLPSPTVSKILNNTVPPNASGVLTNNGSGTLSWTNPGGVGTVTSVTSADGNITVANTTSTPILTSVSAPKLQTGRTISISGDISYTSPSFDGSGNVTAAATYNGTVPVTKGGTNQTSLTAYAPLFGGTTSTGSVQSGTVGTSGQVLTSNGAGALPTFQTAAAGFSNPMTTLGDIMYENATPAAARLPGNTTAAKQFLTSTGNGTISAVPVWAAIVAGDVPTLNQNTTGNAATVTTNANLTGPVTSVGNATTITNSSVTNAMLAGSIDLTTKVTGLLPHANIASTAVTPGSYTNANITVAADGSITAASTNVNTILAPTAEKTANYTAVAGDLVLCDATSSAFAITLPTAPADLTRIGVKMVKPTNATAFTITVALGGSDHINRTTGPTSTTLTRLGRTYTFQYKSSNAVWYVTESDEALEKSVQKVYNVEYYGAVHDGIQTTNVGAITTGTTSFSCTSCSFTSADIGKTIEIPGAGAAGADLVTTISSIGSSTVVTIAATASTTVGTSICWYGTDDTAAIQRAINACFTAKGSKVFFPTGVYIIAGALVTSNLGGNNPNSQIYIPETVPVGSNGVSGSITLEGESYQPFGSTAATAGQNLGVILKSTMNQGTGTRPSVIGTSFYAATTFAFNYLATSFVNLNVMVSSNGGATATNMIGINGLTFVQVSSSDVSINMDLNPQTTLTMPTPLGTGSCGFVISKAFNNGPNTIRNTIVMGAFEHGFVCGEHVEFQNSYSILNYNAVTILPNNFYAVAGRIYIGECPNNFYRPNGTFFGITQSTTYRQPVNLVLDFEKFNNGPSWSNYSAFVNDAAGFLIGEIKYKVWAGGSTGTDNSQNAFAGMTNGNYLNVHTMNTAFPNTFNINGGPMSYFPAFVAGNANNYAAFQISSGVATSTTANTAHLTLSTNQSGTATQLVGGINVVNDNIGGAQSAERRVGLIGFYTNGAVNTSQRFDYVMNAGTLTQIANYTPTNYGVSISTQITQPVLTSSWVPALRIDPGAHTGITLSTPKPNFLISPATHQWATGALSGQANAEIGSETLSFVGASTATEPTGLLVHAPTAGTNANTFVRPSALTLDGHLFFKTGGTVFGVIGSTTNDAAIAGNVGEHVSSLIAIGSAVSLTTATAANVTSISLTAGDWDVTGTVNFSETTSTVTGRIAGLSSTSATLPTDGSEGYCGVQSTVTSETNSVVLSRKRFSLSGTTTIYLVGQATFSAGTCAGFGNITARRIR